MNISPKSIQVRVITPVKQISVKYKSKQISPRKRISKTCLRLAKPHIPRGSVTRGKNVCNHTRHILLSKGMSRLLLKILRRTYLIPHNQWNGKVTACSTSLVADVDWMLLSWVFRGSRDLNTLRPRRNGSDFADDIFKCVFLNENVSIPIKISLKFVPNHSMDNIPALVEIIAGRQTGDTPLSQPMMS